MDAVVAWIDSSDPNILLGPHIGLYNTYEMDRLGKRDSLRYVLRGLYYNLPWLDNIYLVTNNQWPKWLDEVKCSQISPKIIRIDHTTINPEKKPMYGSIAIEVCLDNIPNLSENFIYLNDDMFVIKHMDIEEWIENGTIKMCLYGRPEDEEIYSTSLDPYLKFVYNQYIMGKELYPNLKWSIGSHQATIFSKLSYKIVKEKLPELYRSTYKTIGRPDTLVMGRPLIEHTQIAEGLAKKSIDFCEKNLFCDAATTDWIGSRKNKEHVFDEKKITENTKLLCINNIHDLPNDIENCLKKIFPVPITAEI